MKILVLGHSTSGGNGLPDRALAWPWLVAEQLREDLGTTIELEHAAIIPMGSRAVDYALSKVEAARPAIVVVSIASYLCSIRTVSEQVRHLFGKRVHGWYLRFERRFDARTRTRGGAAARANRVGRSVFRKVIGTRSYTSVTEVAGVFNEILHRLAREESLQVVVFSEPDWPAWVDEANPGALRAIQELRRLTAEVARSHHFIVASAQDAYDRSPDRDALYQLDGVHKTPEGHRVQAAALQEAITRLARQIEATPHTT